MEYLCQSRLPYSRIYIPISPVGHKWNTYSSLSCGIRATGPVSRCYRFSQVWPELAGMSSYCHQLHFSTLKHPAQKAAIRLPSYAHQSDMRRFTEGLEQRRRLGKWGDVPKDVSYLFVWILITICPTVALLLEFQPEIAYFTQPNARAAWLPAQHAAASHCTAPAACFRYDHHEQPRHIR